MTKEWPDTPGFHVHCAKCDRPIFEQHKAVLVGRNYWCVDVEACNLWLRDKKHLSGGLRGLD